MRCFTTFIAFLTMTAYALGLPMWLHEGEHARAASAACVICTAKPTENSWHYRLSLLSHRSDRPSLPPKEECPTCVKIQGTIAAPDTPIVLLSAGAWQHQVVCIDLYQHDQASPRDIPCRGPPIS